MYDNLLQVMYSNNRFVVYAYVTSGCSEVEYYAQSVGKVANWRRKDEEKIAEKYCMDDEIWKVAWRQIQNCRKKRLQRYLLGKQIFYNSEWSSEGNCRFEETSASYEKSAQMTLTVTLRALKLLRVFLRLFLFIFLYFCMLKERKVILSSMRVV